MSRLLQQTQLSNVETASTKSAAHLTVSKININMLQNCSYEILILNRQGTEDILPQDRQSVRQ